MTDRVVHIGYPKTATTYLQNHVFPNLKGVTYHDYYTCQSLFPDVAYLDDLDYDEEKLTARLSDLNASSTTLYSFEALAGAPFVFKGLGRSNIPERLKSLGFTRVIITIRSQTQTIDSLYRQYVVQGGVMRFRDFLDRKGRWNPFERAFNLDYLKYDGLIQRYQEVFGRESVLVLPQEGLSGNKDAFLSHVEEFLGTSVIANPDTVKANRSLTNASVRLLRVLNFFTYNSFQQNQFFSRKISSRNAWKFLSVIGDPLFMRWFSGRKSFLKGADSDFIRDYYRDSNSQLSRLVNFDLSELGYP